MKHLIIDPREADDVAFADAFGQAADLLRHDGVVAFPTDTSYAIAVDPRSDDAVRKVIEIRGADPPPAIPLVAADREQAETAGTFGASERRLAHVFWPGPLTILVDAARGISPLLSGGTGTVGIGVPAHPVARALAAAFGAPVTAGTASLSGHPASVTADEVAAVLGERIDLLLDAGPAPAGPASTVVQLVSGRLTLHQAGAVAWDRVLESLQ